MRQHSPQLLPGEDVEDAGAHGHGRVLATTAKASGVVPSERPTSKFFLKSGLSGTENNV